MNLAVKLSKWCLLYICCTFYLNANAQDTSFLTLEQCYQLAEANYPLSKQRSLIELSKNYTISNISKGIYPQLVVSGTATYQSDVTKIDISFPGVNIPSPSKDQYKLSAEVSQSLTDFPTNKIQKQISAAQADLQQENLTIELYKLKDRINQLYFGVLMIDEQLKQSDLVKNDINVGVKEMQAAIDNGTGFHSNLDKLNAELLKIIQRDIELKASRKAYTDMLALFINKNITEQTVLQLPASPTDDDNIKRPELQAFELQRKTSLLQRKLIATKSYPKLNAFFQGGLGKPSPVNMLKDGFAPYYITGLRLNWSPTSLYTFKKEKLQNENERKIIDVQQNTFLFNTQVAVKQQNSEIQKYLDLIKSDEAIIALRESVKKTSAVQLENGVITTNDYLKEVNEENEARQNKILHTMQLLMTQYAQKTTTGN
ncbi:MAG: TolC family protein [Chitinophagales bacterium]